MKTKVRLSLVSMLFKMLTFAIAFILIFSFVGCNKNDVTEPTNNPGVNSSDAQLGDQPQIDPLTGQYYTKGEIVSLGNGSNEVRPETPSSNRYNPAKGFADSEALAKRTTILNTKNTEDLYPIYGTTYYISPNGDDINDGLSTATPFKTLAALNSVVLKAGDAVLFERGSVFRFNQILVAGEGVTYGSYGVGEKPVFEASPYNYANLEWTPSVKKNVWQTSYAYEVPCGVFIDFGSIIGRFKDAGVAYLEANGDFYFDEANGIIYVFCDQGNPSKVYKSIEISPGRKHIDVPSNVGNIVIDNINFQHGSYGIDTAQNSKNLTVTNCEFGYIGGMTGHDVRRGNAIEVWEGCDNLIVENNWFYQTFDSALTWQGKGGVGTEYTNISFSNNLFEYNNADIEFFDTKGAVVDNFKMNNNIMRFTSMGWGTREDDGGIRGIEGVIRAITNDMEVVKNITFCNNIIDCPARQIVDWISAYNQKSNIKTQGNKLYLNAAYRTTSMVLQGLETSADDTQVLKAENLEQLKAAISRFDSNMEIVWKN